MTKQYIESFLNEAGKLENPDKRREAFALYNHLYPNDPKECLGCGGDTDHVLIHLYLYIGIQFQINTLREKRWKLRLEICKVCPHLVQPGWTCGQLLTGRDLNQGTTHDLCGCFVRLKVRLKNESCPQGKW